MAQSMTLAQTILALQGIPDQRPNPLNFYGRLVFPALGDLAPDLRALGLDATNATNDTDSDLWIHFDPTK